MSSDIEISFEVTNEDGTFIRRIVDANDAEEQTPIFSHIEYVERGGLLESMMSYNSKGFKTSETTYTWFHGLHRRRSHFPSGYTLDIGFAIHRETDEWYPAFITLTDPEERPHGLCDNVHGKGYWHHGIPLNYYKMYLFEYGNDNDGRVYFFPLKGGYFLVDHFYVYFRRNVGERMFNIYRLGDASSTMGFVFGKDDPHIFNIICRDNFRPAANRYFVPVDFVFQDHVSPTADDALFERQKKAALAFIDAQELPSEEYDKSARHYERAIESCKRRNRGWFENGGSDSDSE
jgi:hypothetical protein